MTSRPHAGNPIPTPKGLQKSEGLEKLEGRQNARKFTLIWTQTFIRTARKFIQRHPEYDELLEDTLKQIEQDPHASRLRLHPLKGPHTGKHAVSLSYEYRIVLILKLSVKEIILLDIGSHDEVYHHA